MTSLTERIEAATGPCRDLDAQIALRCLPQFSGWIEHPANNGNQYGELAPSREAFDEWLIHDGEPCLIAAPAYTSSLDAAMTLYIDKPAMVSSDPRKVVLDALRQREKVLGKGRYSWPG